MPDDIGRRYGAVSGDRNPIHLHSLTAKAFGFPSAIAHGMWLKARTLATLEGRLPDAFTVDVAFKTPVLLPSTIAITPSRTDGRLDARRPQPAQVGQAAPGRIDDSGRLDPRVVRPSGVRRPLWLLLAGDGVREVRRLSQSTSESAAVPSVEPTLRTVVTQRVVRLVDALLVRAGRVAGAVGEARVAGRRRGAGSRRPGSRAYSSESDQRRSSAARTTANGWVCFSVLSSFSTPSRRSPVDS